MQRKGVLALCMVVSAAALAFGAADSWSPTMNGLQARIVIVQKPAINGSRWLVPYLELRSGVQFLTVDCDWSNLKFELVDKEGKAVQTEGPVAISGPDPSLGLIRLPPDSSISLSLEARNLAIGRTEAIISRGAWFLEKKHKGKVFMRATLIGSAKETKNGGGVWSGEIKMPPVRVDWK